MIDTTTSLSLPYSDIQWGEKKKKLIFIYRDKLFNLVITCKSDLGSLTQSLIPGNFCSCCHCRSLSAQAGRHTGW